MANVLVSESSLSAIADAIRSKNGSQETYKPSQMANAIRNISGGGTTPTGTKQISITANGTTTEDVTNYASAEIAVNVPTSGGVETGTVVGNNSKTISITTTKQYSNVIVLVSSADIPTETAWHCLFAGLIAGENYNASIYNGSNIAMVRNQPTFSFSENEISITNLKYTTFDGVTYHWRAW